MPFFPKMIPEPEPEPIVTSDDSVDVIIKRYYYAIRGSEKFNSKQGSAMIGTFYHLFIKSKRDQNTNFLIDKEVLTRIIFGVSASNTIPFEIKIRQVTTKGKIYICFRETTNDHIIHVRLWIKTTSFDYDTVLQRMIKASDLLSLNDCPELFDGSAPLVSYNDAKTSIAFEMEILRSTFYQSFTFDLFLAWIEYLAHSIAAMNMHTNTYTHRV